MDDEVEIGYDERYLIGNADRYLIGNADRYLIGNAGDQSRDFFFEGRGEFHERKAALFLPAANILAWGPAPPVGTREVWIEKW